MQKTKINDLRSQKIKIILLLNRIFSLRKAKNRGCIFEKIWRCYYVRSLYNISLTHFRIFPKFPPRGSKMY